MLRGILKFGLWFLAGLLVGYVLGRFLPRTSTWNNWGLVKNVFTVGQQDTQSVDNLIGQVLSVKNKSLVFKTRIQQGENLLVAQKEAEVNEQTVIFLLTPKTENDFYPAEYQEKLTALRQALKEANLKKDLASSKRVLEQIKALTAEASAAVNLKIQALEQKLTGLKDGSQEKLDLEAQLAELSSNFKYNRVGLAEIKPGQAVQVWAKGDLNNLDKFIATKIEIRQ